MLDLYYETDFFAPYLKIFQGINIPHYLKMFYSHHCFMYFKYCYLKLVVLRLIPWNITEKQF